MLLRPSILLPILTATATLLAGCCANNVCDCNDSRADAIYLRYQVDGISAFRPEEIYTISVLRFKVLPKLATDKPVYDSVAFVRTASTVNQPIVINNNAPFGQASSLKLNNYEGYVLKVGTAGRVIQQDVLQNIKLSGSFEADGCCTCYRNISKTADLVAVGTTDRRYNTAGLPVTSYTLTETDGQPVPIVIARH
jgi:hypothetical protein